MTFCKNKKKKYIYIYIYAFSNIISYFEIRNSSVRRHDFSVNLIMVVN